MVKIKALILCAGYATRLYPLTIDSPKPLLPIAGKPMIEHILERIKNIEEIDEILIITNNKFFDHFRNWKRQYSSTKPIKIINDNTNSDEDRLGAIGDISFAVKSEKIGDNLLVIAGDNLFKSDFKELFEHFNEKKSSIVALYDIKDRNIASGKYGVVELDKNNKILELEEKPKNPKTSLISTACYILTKADLSELENCIKTNQKLDNLGDFIRWLAARKDIFGFVFNGQWFDIGSREQIKEADMAWSKK